MAVFGLVEPAIVSVGITLALVYALNALIPSIIKQRLLLRFGDRLPAWLRHRLRPSAGCDACPAQARVKTPRA